jgi:hypothetical protein
MSVEKLLIEQRRLIAAIERIEAISTGDCDDGGVAKTDDRWNFTRHLMLFLSHLDNMVLLPLVSDPRADAVRKAMDCSGQLHRFHEDFLAHVHRWQGRPGVARWSEYCAVIDSLMARLRSILATVERDLYPLMPARSAGASRSSSNFAAAAWSVRDTLYPGETGRTG